ncbi:restriction endonuclease subunit S [Fibrobacter sp. UWB10]|uniref:restriction endonuclease subunit S n=1 Tax=Fibrobacter sp. UWB10 TaxID=1896201 RepID=UPI0024033CF4|nr:restriction endonuclease subunit S [Fibrobacter sp. UWB10]SMP55018.1 type I restriction enzyme, S subunit [Fibrobacter sp. UWB10]
MGLSNLTTYKLGDLIEPLDERNSDGRYGANDVRGVSNLKQMMRTKADLFGRDLRKFQIVKPGYFVFNHRTSRNGSKFSVTYNYDSENHIFTEDYVVFRVKEKCLTTLSPKWLYIYFCRAEFDRYVITNSWGSSTEFFNWDDLCDITITLPDFQTQQKYVDIYDAMCANQKAYEKGLDDLKLTCDAYIEELRRKMPCEKIGPYIQECDSKNSIGLTIDSVRGIATSKELIPTKANMDGVSLENYKVVAPLQITYVPDTSRRGDKISLGINKSDKPILVSSISIVFETEKKSLLSEYLMLFFVRSEFDRYARFNSWGSARETFDWNALCDYKIPIPDITTQKNIAEIYKAFNIRKDLNEKLKQQIKNICPILIKGAVEEGKSKRG